jgi:mono/diheme cytochrome c family protein
VSRTAACSALLVGAIFVAACGEDASRPAPRDPAGYQSDMPGFAGKLSDDEIRSVLAFIESRWSREVLDARAEMLRDARRR